MDEDRGVEAELSDGIGTGSDAGQQMEQEKKDYSSYIDRPLSALSPPRGFSMESPAFSSARSQSRPSRSGTSGDMSKLTARSWCFPEDG